LKILDEVRERYQFSLVGYVVMPEHIHLLISEPELGNPSTVMQALKQRVARSERSESKSESVAAVARGARSNAAQFLAETVLRFQRLEREEEN
jgi:REP element-mobilizing transposase RayT